jgi:hypothetical protein
MPARPSIVFTTLAMNQTTFFGTVGELLRDRGFPVSFICFHDRSADYLRRRGLKAASAYQYERPIPDRPDFDQFGVERVNLLISHEKVAFGIPHSDRLLRKLWRLLNVIDGLLEQQVGRGPAVMVQEFGGFLSLVAAYYAARSRGFDNVFIEPSFFRGRVVFVRNSFKALPIEAKAVTAVSGDVSRYIEQALKQQQLVIPKKDSHHYRSASRKVFDARNARRLAEKWVDKYLLGKREEFEHIGGHVGRHLRMLANGLRMRRHYRDLPASEPFVYYPLHVPNDAALTVRSPEFLDQYAFLDYLARVLPHNYRLAVKEHPALVGAIDYRRLRELLASNDNFMMLSPALNNYQVMSAASAVVTVNSKSGAEALLLGKPVLVMGDAFYRTAPFVFRIDRLGDLPEVLTSVLARQPEPIGKQVQPYFQAVWDCSFAGELYDNGPENVSVFSRSLEKFITP